MLRYFRGGKKMKAESSSKMKSRTYDMAVIGGGAAGLAGAVKAAELGMDVVVLESGERIGGIPMQCIHPGFGNFYYRENLTGPEFSERLIEKVKRMEIECHTRAHVEGIRHVSDTENMVSVVMPAGITQIRAKTILYAAGARERHAYEIGITGDRVSGVYTAGEAQTLMDIYGIMPGKSVVIIGSGDIGLIMARRFALEGADVKAVVEMLPYPGGLQRNVVQCLEDFGIPLLTSHMVTRIVGKKRVERVILAEVDESFRAIKNSEKEIDCDTVALAAGLVPNIGKLREADIDIDSATNGPVVNEYMETSLPGIFVAGNALAINDYVDYAAEQGEQAAIGAHLFIEGNMPSDWKPIRKGENIRLVFPHHISGGRDVKIYARVKKPVRDAVVEFPEIDKRVRKRAVMPGEMIIVNLKKQETAGIDELTLRCADGN